MFVEEKGPEIPMKQGGFYVLPGSMRYILVEDGGLWAMVSPEHGVMAHWTTLHGRVWLTEEQMQDRLQALSAVLIRDAKLVIPA